MTASPKRHRHRAEPLSRRAPSWPRSRTISPLVSIGIVAVAVLTSASASSAPRTGSAEPAQQAPTAVAAGSRPSRHPRRPGSRRPPP